MMTSTLTAPSTASHTAVSDSFRKADLLSLIHNEIQILRIPNFIGENACRSISDGLKKTGYNDYLNAPQVGRIGMSYFETGRQPDIIEHYFANALANINLLREACSPYPCPMDTFRCVVDETWEAGCTLQTLYEKKMFVGLSRSMKPGIPLKAHHDMFGRHAPNTPESDSLISQFGVNIYIDVPETGGELGMWDDELSDDEFLDRRGQDYAIPLDQLRPCDYSAKPENGDLILFNARKLHAVLPGEGKDRLTISAFLGYRGEKEALTVWS
ncbi:2OG-Fe(II) oxygenase [Polycladidibacter hongkongensis]|uniref:2OG-Fe(II)-dependent halogenase WelO5 family protein n=1 Tax=Polycladidibacter hongkongensis TaxID=1647556 RepID=UPI0008365D89|nr:2OG-Fe(II) oxygenase [Pseudovibrio hongkongensis]